MGVFKPPSLTTPPVSLPTDPDTRHPFRTSTGSQATDSNQEITPLASTTPFPLLTCSTLILVLQYSVYAYVELWARVSDCGALRVVGSSTSVVLRYYGMSRIGVVGSFSNALFTLFRRMLCVVTNAILLILQTVEILSVAPVYRQPRVSDSVRNARIRRGSLLL
ncbi:hypothetical protein MAR_003525 [Mya arenaria]|uniref:Uncharacterized protein n=1 Tax=Mya arenaria TaxID=6604 RepID=A0ABY7G7R0_MYAAR|nr:hypothetical protein MAR_003525 [Mya arenaria]